MFELPVRLNFQTFLPPQSTEVAVDPVEATVIFEPPELVTVAVSEHVCDVRGVGEGDGEFACREIRQCDGCFRAAQAGLAHCGQ